VTEGALLRVERASVQYGAVRAVDELSIHVDEGSIVTLVGPNGAGKTSLIGAICGFAPLTSGKVWFDGAEIGGLPVHEIARRGIALVPERRELFPEMNVVDNLLTAAIYTRSRPNRGRLLEEVYGLFPVLRERAGQSAGSLSGGQQQILAIGRALMAEPRLMILDEPSLGLAPLLVRDMFKIVRGLRERGLTVLLVEQNVRQSLRIADRAYVLEGGRVYLEGLGHEVAQNSHVRKAYLGVV
jgi:branched-chain amino acid transport system ATP-binding protein